MRVHDRQAFLVISRHLVISSKVDEKDEKDYNMIRRLGAR